MSNVSSHLHASPSYRPGFTTLNPATSFCGAREVAQLESGTGYSETLLSRERVHIFGPPFLLSSHLFVTVSSTLKCSSIISLSFSPFPQHLGCPSIAQTGTHTTHGALSGRRHAARKDSLISFWVPSVGEGLSTEHFFPSPLITLFFPGLFLLFMAFFSRLFSNYMLQLHAGWVGLCFHGSPKRLTIKPQKSRPSNK